MLAQFDHWDVANRSASLIADLDAKIVEFGHRITAFLEENLDAGPERRLHQNADAIAGLLPGKKIWLVSSAPDNWREVVTQAGYFNIEVTVFDPNADLQGQTGTNHCAGRCKGAGVDSIHCARAGTAWPIFVNQHHRAGVGQRF